MHPPALARRIWLVLCNSLRLDRTVRVVDRAPGDPDPYQYTIRVRVA
jgi:hypothetical protein